MDDFVHPAIFQGVSISSPGNVARQSQEDTEMSSKNNKHFMRALRVITARSKGADAAIGEERAFAQEMLGDPDVIVVDDEVRPTAHPSSRGQTAFAATEQFAKDLYAAMVRYTRLTGTSLPKDMKYSPLASAPVIFKGVWQCRQMADQLGVPYSYYAESALDYWATKGRKRVPLPSQLYAPDVALHVMAAWQQAAGELDIDGNDEAVAV